MEKRINKKILAGLCALSAGFVLASCDPIVSVPSDYNEKLIANVDYDENKLGTIYDQVDAERNSKIVSNKLKEIAIKRFGTYQEIEKAHTDLTYLKGTYLPAHTDFFGTVEADQLHRFEVFYEDIHERISEYFYNEIVSGSYDDDEGRFDEEKLYMAHYYEFYDITKPDVENKFYVTEALTKQNAFSKLKGNYSSEEGRGYIEEKVFPDILKDKLVEDYIYRNNQGSIGRSYARKVSYIKVSYSESHGFSWNLLKKFAHDYIDNDETSTEIPFDLIAKALKGFDGFDEEANRGGITPLNADSLALLSDPSVLGEPVFEDSGLVKANAVKLENDVVYNDDTLIQAGVYYKETKLGALVESFNKAIKAEEAGRFADPDDATELAKFTENGKPKEYGLRKELAKLAKEDCTTDGWFVKNGGLSDLPSEAIRNRLFNIRVANSLDATEGKNKLFEETPSTLGQYENDTKTLPYMRSINGKKVILPAGAQPFKDEPYNYIYHDKDGKSFYIVQVLEAPSKAKLSEDSSTRYTEEYKIEDISRQVAKLLGTKESYTKDAYTEYLNKYSDFKFYDSSFYDYLKAEFPDLNCFDEE